MSDDIPPNQPGLFGLPPTEPNHAARAEKQLRKAARDNDLYLVGESEKHGFALTNANGDNVHSGANTDKYGLSLADVAKYLKCESDPVVAAYLANEPEADSTPDST